MPCAFVTFSPSRFINGTADEMEQKRRGEGATVYTDLVFCEKPHRGTSSPHPPNQNYPFHKTPWQTWESCIPAVRCWAAPQQPGGCPPPPLSGVLTPPDPPKGLICKPVEPVASPAPVLDSYAILLATVTTLLTLLNHRTVWRGSGGSNSPPSSQCQCPPSSQCQCGATVSEI
jgi:hypothetical protein